MQLSFRHVFKETSTSTHTHTHSSSIHSPSLILNTLLSLYATISWFCVSFNIHINTLIHHSITAKDLLKAAFLRKLHGSQWSDSHIYLHKVRGLISAMCKGMRCTLQQRLLTRGTGILPGSPKGGLSEWKF